MIWCRFWLYSERTAFMQTRSTWNLRFVCIFSYWISFQNTQSNVKMQRLAWKSLPCQIHYHNMKSILLNTLFVNVRITFANSYFEEIVGEKFWLVITFYSSSRKQRLLDIHLPTDKSFWWWVSHVLPCCEELWRRLRMHKQRLTRKSLILWRKKNKKSKSSHT